MSESLGVIRIRQLSEKAQLSPTDWLVVEDDVDTWKTKVGSFNTYIESAVEDLSDSLLDGIDAKLNEIQILVNKVEEMTNNLAISIKGFEEAEAIRIKNENDRKTNETIRQADSADMLKAEADREAAEIIRRADSADMLKAEADRKSSEIQRKADEAIRKSSETNRGIAENDRQVSETERKANEVIRKSNETNRVSSFSSMEIYFNKIKASIENMGNEGISKPTTASDTVVKIMEISIPTNATMNYESMLHLAITNSSTTNEGFFSVDINFNRNSSNVIIGASLNLSFPDRYPFFKTSQFNAYARITGSQITVAIEYKASAANTVIKCGLVWDNITVFKHDVVMIYSQIIRDSVPKSTVTSAGAITILESTGFSCPHGFIAILDAIKKETEDIVANIKPFESYPIGSIYQSTLSTNPGTTFGGGTWKLLYGDGIQEVITVDGVATYGPMIYTWERES